MSRRPLHIDTGLTGNFLSRRRFLGGAAVTVALPFLPSRPGERRAHAAGRRKGAARPKRLVVYHVPNGFYRPDFHPRGEGECFELSPTLEALEDLRNEILIPRGIANTFAVPIPTGGAHAVGCAALLTCTYPRKDKIELARSLDQYVADAIGGQTRHASLQLGMDTIEGQQEYGWPMVYPRTISWANATQPLPNVSTPQRAFERMFMGLDPRAGRADIELRRYRRSSVLDAVAEHGKSLALDLDAADRAKLEQYLTHVREAERRIQGVQRQIIPRRLVAKDLADDTADYATNVAQFQDLILLALKLDVTRVITFSCGNGLSGRPMPFLGIGNAHNETHHSKKPDKIENVKKMDKWRVERFAEFLRAMRAEKDAEGRSLLEDSVVLYMSEVNDGQRHDQHDKTMVIAGQLGGAIKTGRVLYAQRPTAYEDDTYTDCSEYSRTAKTPLPEGCVEAPQLADVYLGLLKAFGVHLDRFGQNGSNRPIDLG